MHIAGGLHLLPPTARRRCALRSMNSREEGMTDARRAAVSDCANGSYAICPPKLNRTQPVHWTGSGACGWEPATTASLRSLLSQLPYPSLLFWGDSTFRQLYLEGAELAMARGLDDDVCTKTPQNVYGTLGSTPYLPNENVDFDNFTCATGACQTDGCLVRCSRQVGTTLNDGAPATVGWYGSGRLHCPSASPLALSLYAQLRKQCPGAIVAGHNVWDCRWVKHGRAKWPNYRYTEDIANATRAVSAICPRTLKVWRSSVHLDPAFNTSKWKEMHRCMQVSSIAARAPRARLHLVTTMPKHRLLVTCRPTSACATMRSPPTGWYSTFVL